MAKSKISVFVTFLILLFAHSGYTQCGLDNATVDISECNEDDTFTAILSFDFENQGSDGFQVLGNNTNYGTFQYEALPIMISNLEGNCTTAYEFIIRDVVDPTCSTFIEYGTVCCNVECNIEFSSISVSECTDDLLFDIEFDLSYENINNASFVNVLLNGENIAEVAYEDLPYTLDGLSTEEIGNNTLTVCDNNDSECCATYTFLNPCNCAITNILTDIIECDMTEESYYAIIDFDHIATNDSFQLGYSEGGSNNFLGVFGYNELPVTVGPIFMSANEREILIVDTEDFFCYSPAFFGVVDDCDINCQISNVFAESYDCADGTYYIDVEFDTEDIEGSSFDVIVDDVNYGTFTYGDSPYTVGPIAQNCQNPPFLIIQDSELETCNDFFTFEEPICCGLACEFDVFEGVVECEDETITLTVTYSNVLVLEGDQYYIFFFSQLFGPYDANAGQAVLSIPELQNGTYPISIFVDGNEDCNAENLIVVDCISTPDCSISEVFAEPSECMDGQIFLDVEFQYEGEVSDSFTISLNGLSVGTFAYGDDFYTVGPIEPNCEITYEVSVSDLGISNCNASYSLPEPLCCDIDCEFESLEVFDITCENGNVSGFNLNFEYILEDPQSFDLFIGEELIGSYAYSELPLQVTGTFDAAFELAILNSGLVICGAELSVQSDCDAVGECIIDEGELTYIGCIDDLYDLSLDFIYESTSDSFNVAYNGTINTYAYVDLPISLGGLPVGEEVIFNIFDQLNEDCGITRSYLLEECNTDSATETPLDDIEIYNLEHSISIINTTDLDTRMVLRSITGQTIAEGLIDKRSSYLLNKEHIHSGLYLLSLSFDRAVRTQKVFIAK